MSSLTPSITPPSLAATAPASSAAVDAGEREVLCEDMFALRFSERLKHCARYVAPWRRWMVFDGAHWHPDESLRVLHEARVVCRALAKRAAAPYIRARIRSAATIATLERLARGDACHAATPDQWDRDPWLLNTPGGTIDLRTGALGPHRREDWITRMTAVTPGGDCPLFLAFLDRIFAGDAALIAFVRRALGYALTGLIAEHALFFCYGTGGNGKSVLLNTVAGIIGSYAVVAPAGSFSARGESPSADHAMLRGARLVVAQETERGRRWNEARLKMLTGGDAVTTRERGGTFLTHRPGFKLFVAGNHPPELACVDEAIRRRFNLVPFGVTIHDPDPALARKLEAEWPGILAWMIAGCREWQDTGLATPAAVTEATAAYLTDEDTFGAWLDECVAATPGASETSAALYTSWASYAQAAQEQAGSKKAFSHALLARGFVAGRVGHASAKGFKGMQLKTGFGRPDPENRTASDRNPPARPSPLIAWPNVEAPTNRATPMRRRGGIAASGPLESPAIQGPRTSGA